jgi:hypothetical protein
VDAAAVAEKGNRRMVIEPAGSVLKGKERPERPELLSSWVVCLGVKEVLRLLSLAVSAQDVLRA